MDPKHVTKRTLAAYDARAEEFWEGTRDHDVSQNYEALLSAIRASPPFAILDLGCGPGRDLRYFRSLGHEAVGVEGSARFAEMAREHSGCEVLEQDFLELRLAEGRFDGIFANASLFHVPLSELDRVLRDLRSALKREGVLFSSNPRGNGEDGWRGNRYGVFHDLAGWTKLVKKTGFSLVTHYYRPAGKPLHEQPWLATVWRKDDDG